MITLHHHHNIFCWFAGISAMEEFLKLWTPNLHPEKSPLMYENHQRISPVTSILRQILSYYEDLCPSHSSSQRAPITPILMILRDHIRSRVFTFLHDYASTSIRFPHRCSVMRKTQISSQCNHLAFDVFRLATPPRMPLRSRP